MDAEQLRVYVIAPVLRHLGLDSLAAQNLLLGTAAQETAMGQYIVQLGSGPARGYLQIEPKTHDDLWSRFLSAKPLLSAKVRAIMSPWGELHDQLVWSLAYSTAIGRLIYFRDPEPLPDAKDVQGLAAYWKRVWNTHLGKGTEEQFVRHYLRYVTE